jgi:hypothetical protein
MNWRRGTLRLVMVASICWSGVGAWILYQDSATISAVHVAQSEAERACADRRIADPALGDPFACHDVGPAPYVPRIWAAIFKLIVLPIAGAFLGWFVMIWVVSGFLPKPK